MPEDTYTVKINRAEGILEITGPDKGWIAEQLDKLAVVYAPSSVVEHANGKTETPRRAPEAKTKTRRSGGRAKRNPDLEAKLTPAARTKLQKYVDERDAHWKRKSDQLAIIATFLLDELHWSAIDEDDVYTVYVTMGWTSPARPRSALENARGRDGYFGSWATGKLQLSHKGENFGRGLPANGE